MIKYDSPLVDDTEVAKLHEKSSRWIQSRHTGNTFEPSNDDNLGSRLISALEHLFDKADALIEEGTNILILSDRGVCKDKAAIPALLACAGLHHHLIRKGTRTKVSLIIESGEPREVMHFTLLLGYGADLINPYLSLETIRFMISDGNLCS